MERLAEIPDKCARALLEGPQATGRLCVAYAKRSVVHGAWTYPLNAISCLVSVCLMPLVALIGVVVAGILWVASFSAEEGAMRWYEKKISDNWNMVEIGFLGMVVLFVAIIFPGNLVKGETRDSQGDLAGCQ